MIDYMSAARDAATSVEMPAGFSIRTLTEEDLAQVVAVERILFPRDAWSPQMLEDEITGPFRIYVGVFDETDTMVGYGGSTYSLDAGEIMTIGVVPECRGKHLGVAMTNALVAAADVLRVGAMFLEVRESNSVARNMYEGLGFAEIDRRKRYYHNPTEDAVIMRKVF